VSLLSHISRKLGMDTQSVRSILLELASSPIEGDKHANVFKAATEEGLDLNKLRIARRINTRKEAIEEILRYIEANPKWKKDDVISYLRYSRTLMLRVEKKILPDFFDDEFQEK